MNLNDCTLDNTPPLIVQNITCEAKVLKVYDGDTITVAFDPFKCGKYFYHNVRLSGINAPEIKTTRPKEKQLGLDAKTYLTSLILSKIVTLVIDKNIDKYGRTSAIVMVGDVNICDELVLAGYAKTYSGGVREPWFSDE
jgi:micrococcal nuclease